MRAVQIIKRFLLKLKLRKASPHERAEIMRPYFFHMGKNVKLYTLNFGTEPYLVSIGDDVVCATDVTFVNHDVSCFNVARYLKLPLNSLDKVGPIVLGDNCFIGAKSILMPNCSVGKNSVVASGSIVTKNIPDNQVWGGMPAKFIMTIDEYAKKIVDVCRDYPWLENKETMSEQELILARQNYFFKGRTLDEK